MVKKKASVTVDPLKVAQARALLGSATLSKLIDIALDRVIAEELDRSHVAGYALQPPGPNEVAWGEAERDPTEIADDVDWADLYGVSRG